MPIDPVKYILGDSDSRYFQELLKSADTLLSPEDEIDTDDDEKTRQTKLYIQLAKKQTHFDRLHSVAVGIRQPWFQLVETALMDRVRQIESHLYWDAESRGETLRASTLASERAGIIALFSAFKNVSRDASVLSDQIDALKNQELEDNPLED
jgi:hypothetical protein